MRYDVFISYSSRDEKKAAELCGLLEKEGLVCFRDHGPNGIAPGDNFMTSLQTALQNSRSLILILSENSVADDCWAMNEVVMAKKLRLHIFPIQISHLPDQYSLQLAINTIQMVNATDTNMIEIVKEIIPSLMRFAGKGNAVEATQRPADDISVYARQHGMIGIKLFEIEEYEDAVPELRRAAKLGDAESQYYYGLCHFFGHGGLEADARQADEWFAKSAVQNNPKAQNLLAVHLYLGQGNAEGKPDREKAKEWFSRAAAQGNGDAMLNLGFFAKNENDTHQSVEWFRMAEQKGNIEAAVQLGEYYKEIGKKEMALQYYRKAANEEHGYAQNMLGLLLGVDGKCEEAVQWLRRAVDNGSVPAQFNLGHCFFYGNGVPKDMDKGIKMMHKAIRIGYLDGRDVLKKCIQGLPLLERMKYKGYIV